MRTPATNAAGYNASAVRDTAGFAAAPGGFAIMHGTGDDNVHYQNSAALLDLLVGAGLGPEKADWRVSRSAVAHLAIVTGPTVGMAVR